MSPTDAKRGAKRRKNKRGGGGTGCSGAVGGKAGAPAAARSPQAGSPSSVMGFLTAGGTGSTGAGGVAGLRGEVSMNGMQFSEGPANPEFTNVMQTPFTFGLGQRAPYTAGERCLLCRSERKDCPPLDASSTGSSGTCGSPKAGGLLQLPLWVCPECRRTVETEERPAAPEQPLPSQDFLLHMPMGPSSSASEPIGGSPTLPSPDLGAPVPSDPSCGCEACVERREISAESERESQQLQNYWSEVRYLVRCIYRQTGTPLADDHDQPLDRDQESMKELVDRLCEKDPYQLYQRLEQQAREYVLEMKVRLLKHLSAGSKAPAVQGPPQAHQFMSLLLEEYSALCQAARTISTFLLTLENEHLQKFQVTWELHNKHLFENLVFSEPLLHGSLPSLVAQLRHGTASRDSYSEDMYRTLLENYQQLEREMHAVAAEWLECEKRIDDYVDKQMSLKTKQRMLKEDWEFFKQRRFIEEQLTNSKKSPPGEGNFTEAMRQALSSRISMPDCPNCNYRRRCACDDCSLSHILTCGIMDSPVTDDLHVRLPLPPGSAPAPDFLQVALQPSVSSASSASGSASSSPVPVQRAARLPASDDAPALGGEDDEVPLLSEKFPDIYPLGGYADPKVLAAVNGLHGELNGGGEDMPCKHESPRASSSSSSSTSSSEADEEEADGESGGEPPGQQGALSPGSRSSVRGSSQNDSPPPSYPHQQTEPSPQPCECHACSQALSGLPPGRPHPAGHAFLPEKGSHPALHLYPHIHGHLPLHGLSHLPRPLLHPTVYPSAPLPHSKTLPSTPTSSHPSSKHPVFPPSLPDHVYQNCFGNAAADWNSALQCPSLKFENIWDTNVIKSWNPALFLQDSLPGDMIGPPLPEVPPTAAGGEAPVPTETKERKNGAKKKCLYSFQDAFMEASKGTLGAAMSTPPGACTSSGAQSSDVFHSICKEEHRLPNPVAPHSSPTGLASLPPLTGPPLPPASAAHLPAVASPHFPKRVAPAPGFLDAPHPALYLPPGEPTAAPPVESCVSAPPSVCSDPDCEGHRCEANGAYDHQPYDGDESPDEDSCSEHSSSTSTSTNQKEGKYCDCCYCEFFGHGGPPAAPTSRNFAEMREKLRLRLTKRKEEQPKKEETVPEREGVEDHRKVEDLLQFINSSDSKPTSGAKAAKRARHKQKKMEEKARVEAEAREREEQEQQRQRAQDALKRELLHLQEHLRTAKKKKKERAKEGSKPDPATQSPQPLRESAQKVLESFRNSKEHLLRDMVHLPGSRDGQIERVAGPEDLVNGGDLTLLQSGPDREKPSEATAPSPREQNGKARLRHPPAVPVSELTKKSPESPRNVPEVTPLAFDAALLEVKGKSKPAEEAASELKREERRNSSSSKKQLNHVKEEKVVAVAEPAPPTEPPQLNGKPPSAESPQPKGKNKKNKKKKGDKNSNSIDDVFLPKDIDLDSVEMDETEREVEYFKRFCLDSARQTRQRLSINWSNFSLKKATFAAH